MTFPARTVAFLLVAHVGLAACGGDSPNVDVDLPGGSGTARTITPSDEGDVRVTSVDGAIVLAVVGDSVFMQLGDTIRKQVKTELDSEAQNEGGFGGMVVGAVSSVVNSALSFTVAVPAESVTDLRFENGRLEFNIDGKAQMQVHSGPDKEERGDGGRFTPADADRFMEAVRAAQARRARSR
jgi:hypothetical protein